MINLGYCCINTQLKKNGITTNRTCRKKTFQEKGIEYISELALQNVRDLNAILVWNQENNIKLFRMSSGLFPWMSEYEFEELPDFDHIKDILENLDIGDQRLTFHPDHFNVLASTNEKVVNNTVRELNQHARIMDLMKLPATYQCPINVHVNTTQGGKKESLKRFIDNFERLSYSCQSRLVVENDDKCSQYTIEDLYQGLYKEIEIPITFDYHHHRLHSGKQSEIVALERAGQTWPNDVRQLVHYSSSRMLNEDKSVRAQAHADFIYEEIDTYGFQLDIELEAKKKEQAFLKYRQTYEI